ncbi:DUF4429 domain-containing protein [Streptomyces klenkii]|uniref:DUF4429 domain-containing protein n=1 Tax=Streptomyces klenkii TaxID=1420899 RepID=UPI0036DFAF77
MVTAVSPAGGEVHFDGQLITIRRTGRMARSIFGNTQLIIPIGMISSLEWREATRWHAGHLRFVTAGSLPVAVNRDRHAILFGKQQQPDFEHLRSQVQKALSQ